MVNWYRYYDTGVGDYYAASAPRFSNGEKSMGTNLAGIGMLGDSAGLILPPLVIRNVFDTFTSGHFCGQSQHNQNQRSLSADFSGNLFTFVYVEIYFQEGTGNISAMICATAL